MKKKLLIPILAIGILFTTVSFKGDFFEIAKQIEIFTELFKELNMNYVDAIIKSNGGFVKLKNQEEIPLSRRKKEEFLTILEQKIME
mgnify:CR=1 FL=1